MFYWSFLLLAFLTLVTISNSSTTDTCSHPLPFQSASSSMNANQIAANSLADSIRGCLFGMLVGDALAMPVHWYYNIQQLQRDFGKISNYKAPKYPFPGSIMNLSNTGGGGRGADKGSIIGDVINHGKKKFWLKGGQYHYHHGLKAGENTLDAHVTRVLTASLSKNKAWKQMSFLKDYVKFMTTPGSHNDVYASSAHRMFFANWVQKKPLDECADNDNHNIDAIDALTVIPPLVASMSGSVESSQEIKRVAWELVNSLRRPSKSVKVYVDNYVDLLFTVLSYRMNKATQQKQNEEVVQEEEEKVNVNVDVNGKESQMFANMILEAADKIGQKKYVLQQARVRGDPMVACYIDSSYPALLVYAYKYHSDFQSAVFGSVNGGGENVARSTVLGALFGAFYGFENGIDEKLKTGLLAKQAVNEEIDEFIKVFVNKQANL